MRGITLLVIACPCALVIATPLTIVSALTSAARHGVLIKGGDHLEQLAVVRALATDKTGTLTTGQLAVDGIEVIPATAEMSMVALLATIESRSEHPAAKAIVRYAASRGIQPGDDITDFVSYPGKGVVAQVGGDQVTVGSLRLFDQSMVASFGSARPGSLRVFGRTETGVTAAVTLRDTERPEARALLVALHELGIRPVVMLTGDVESVAREVGQAVGIDEVRAPLLPEEKLLAIAELRAQHGSVAMVGDGVNDAPALAEASVGIAMGGVGSPAAIETADITLMSDNLLHIPYVVSLAKRTRRTIRVNIGAALVLKGILAVGAMLGVVNLAVAVVVGDMGGTLLVMLNAMPSGTARMLAGGSDSGHVLVPRATHSTSDGGRSDRPSRGLPSLEKCSASVGCGRRSAATSVSGGESPRRLPRCGASRNGRFGRAIRPPRI